MKERINGRMCGLAALFSVACLTACSKPDPITIGFIGGLSGNTADLGEAGRNGAMLAFDEANEAGGINGHRLELEVRDDQQKPELARQGVQDLLAHHVSAIIGPMTSAMAMAVQSVIASDNIVMVSPTVSTVDLSNKDDNFLRVISSTADYAFRTAGYLYQKRGQRRLAAIYDLNNRSYTESWLRDFRKAFELRGGAVVKAVSFDAAQTQDFAPAVQELLSAKPDGLIIIASAVSAAAICQKIRATNEHIPVAMTEWSATETLISAGGKAVEGVLVAQFLDRRDSTPRYQQFLKRYKQRFGKDPGFAGVTGYDAANVVITGLRHDADPSHLKATLLGIRQFQGVQQDINLNRFGDADRVTFMTEIRHAHYVTVE
ncbi:ABC transporter substrate-binding protein [Uliginosibacterium gangwonense]|uniref:ABC transporter substrate-binding protein n=1 Tax=Uliginosibacterium gangwonense TaxID=392736 RepID=UPI00035F5383|nr:ABC transporter substrate-binding protein [Uliginosibacterium gangwonense]